VSFARQEGLRRFENICPMVSFYYIRRSNVQDSVFSINTEGKPFFPVYGNINNRSINHTGMTVSMSVKSKVTGTEIWPPETGLSCCGVSLINQVVLQECYFLKQNEVII